jgi:hypothetical protein
MARAHDGGAHVDFVDVGLAPAPALALAAAQRFEHKQGEQHDKEDGPRQRAEFKRDVDRACGDDDTAYKTGYDTAEGELFFKWTHGLLSMGSGT